MPQWRWEELRAARGGAKGFMPVEYFLWTVSDWGARPPWRHLWCGR